MDRKAHPTKSRVWSVSQATATVTPFQYLPTIRLSDVTQCAVRWLWDGFIAFGKVSTIAGNPGLGKSQITASLAATVSNGGVLPMSQNRVEPARVLFLCAEDDVADTISPRCEAAGADLSRIEVVQAIGKGRNTHHFNLRDDIELLDAQLGDYGDVALVVIDPISAYLGGIDSHRNSEVRGVLQPLGEIASRHSVAIVAVDHLSKNESRTALMRVNGSIGFTGMARAVLLVTTDKSDPKRRLLVTAKNNLAIDHRALAFCIERKILDSGIPTSVVSWEKEYVQITAEEAMAPEDNREASALAEAKEFLLQELSDGPQPAKHIKEESEAMGLSWSSIRRAQKQLRIRPDKDAAQWVWRLP